MNSISMQLGSNIRAKRKEKCISQESLALKCGVDRSYMGRIERGEVNITVVKLYQIAFALESDIELILPNLKKIHY